MNNNNSIERESRGKVSTGTGMSGVSELSAGTSSSDPTGETKMCPLHTVDRAIQTSVREPHHSNKEVTTTTSSPVCRPVRDHTEQVYSLTEIPNYHFI